MLWNGFKFTMIRLTFQHFTIPAINWLVNFIKFINLVNQYFIFMFFFSIQQYTVNTLHQIILISILIINFYLRVIYKHLRHLKHIWVILILIILLQNLTIMILIHKMITNRLRKYLQITLKFTFYLLNTTYLIGFLDSSAYLIF